jgi:hypothetical protein
MNTEPLREAPTRCHSRQEVRLEVDRLKRDLDAVERLLDAKLRGSVYRCRADVPRRVKE